MTPNRKPKQRVSNLRLSEISSVDRPAQTGAVAVLLKRADDEDQYDAIVKNAGEVAKGKRPSFATLQYENALLERAALIAQVRGVTAEQALSMSLNTDSVLKDLAIAMAAANGGYDPTADLMQKVAGPVAAEPAATDAAIRKNATDVVGGGGPSFAAAQFEDAMFRRADEIAHHHRITPEQALVKGLKEDDIVKHLAHAADIARIADYHAARGRIAR